MFGVVGFGFFSYGKKQRALIPFLVGVSLCVIPYFMSELYSLLAVGVVLMAIPYFISSPRL